MSYCNHPALALGSFPSGVSPAQESSHPVMINLKDVLLLTVSKENLLWQMIVHLCLKAALWY